jgi:AAA domain
MSCAHADLADGHCRDCGAEVHSWHPTSLVQRAAIPPEPPTIGGLLYLAKRTLLSGPTESLKTWLALILAKAELDAGYFVAWADLDAMGAGEILARLRALGVANDVIDQRFLYYEPEERLVEERLVDVCDTVKELGVRLFVIDAFNPMLSLHGLDPGSTPDIETFWREVATPITAAGATPALLDHVAKNADPTSKHAYGSERKASGAIVHIGFQSTEVFTRGGNGRALLRRHKDRPGFLPHPNIGRLVLVSDGYAVTYSLEEDRTSTGDTFRPTVLMERVSIRLEGQTEARTQTWVEENVTGKKPAIRKALAALVDEGYVAREETKRGHYFTSLRPYREADDEPPDDVDEIASQPRPNRVPSLRSTPTRGHVPTSPSYGDGVVVAVDLEPNPVPNHVPDHPGFAECLSCGESYLADEWHPLRCSDCLEEQVA